jgi:endoglucanase
MNKKLSFFCPLLVACLVPFLASSAKAASLQLVPDWSASGVPTNLSMYVYVPDHVAPNPPILVLLHYWGGGSAGVFAEAQAGGIVAAADQYGFIMVVPQNPDCWDVNSTATLTHDGGGQTQGIAQMVKYAIKTYQANSNRVYVTGTSCGGMMTEALLAVYPDIFKAGASFSGQVVGGAWTPVTNTAQQWGDIARACYPAYSGPRPRVQLWHGTADGTINYSNQVEAIMQWGNVLGLSANPTATTTVIITGITNQWTHQVWKDTNGATLLDAWSEINGPHGTDANLSARYVIPFLGLDKVGPADLGAGGQRGRPKLNAARTTFVGDNGQPLRGPFTSTEWTAATSYDQIAKMKALGFNAVHLYGESFDPSYPTNGSTAPGYAASQIDSIVQSTRDLGLYLVITIGNGAANGNYNRAYITNFWNLYSARYANETHVLFEIQNEPVAWGPPYSSPTATPTGALDMEVAAYKAIRANAPDTPVLLFTYAVLGDSGGASAALTDIHAFNTNVFGNANAVWTNEAVAFHGYAGANAMSNAVSQIIAAGYPCFMTEFAGNVWGTGVGGLDAYSVADLERLGVSWLTFQYIPPTGVSDDVTDPKHYADIVNRSGLSWTPDFGNWPPVRGPYGNGGYPWTTPDYNNNLLTGSLRIEAENFDTGGEGVAYHKLTVASLGGQYRTNEAVDIEATTDTGGGYDVTGTEAGEWLEYTISVSQPGLYNLALRVAGASAGSIQVLAGGINGTNLTGAWTVPATGGAQTWTTISNVVFLTPGQQVLHLDVLGGGFNLNWLQLSPVTAGILANGSYKLLNRASAFAVTAVSASNLVNAAAYTGATAQQWNLQHIGGGEYTITSAANGWSLVSGSGFYFWNNNHYLIQSTGDGCYRIVPTASGNCFETTAGNPMVIDEKISAGSLNQQWAILSPTAPAFPTGLSAVATGSATGSLIWNAVSGATGYNVKRATNSGGAYATIATGVTTTNYADTGLSAGAKYYYVVSAVSGVVESLNSTEAQLRYPKLNGTIIGTAGSWGNSGNTVTNVFDASLSTFFDAPSGNGDWAGLDFGAGVSNVVTQINYCPRSGFESRMVGGVFQGANQSDFSDAVTLFTVATQPSSGSFTTVNITNATAFRYVRYLSPDGGYGNVAELEFYGCLLNASAAPPSLTLLGHWLSGAANFTETSGYSPAGTFDGFMVAGGSYYFTNDVPPNATGVSVYLNNSGIGISNTCLTWDARYTNTLDDQINNSFTVTCWAKGLPGGWNPWVSKHGESGSGWQLRTDGSAPTYPCWTIRNNGVGTVNLGTAVYGNPEDMASRSIAVNDGKWHHYAGTFDAGSGIRCLYVDGELAAAETGNAVYNMAVTNRFMLGARDGGGSISSAGGYGSYFTGNLYDVRIYGSAASQTQIRSIAGLTPPSLTNRVVSGGQMVLTWSWGTLLQATNLLGPWTPVQAASPCTNSPSASQQFFRVSNP